MGSNACSGIKLGLFAGRETAGEQEQEQEQQRAAPAARVRL